MFKQWLKQLIPGRYRPWLLGILSFFNGLMNLPAALRFGLLDRETLFALNVSRHERRIVFVSERPSWREAKLAYGLKKIGWDVIQLHRFQPMFQDVSDFAEMQQFSSPWAASELAFKTRTKAFHTFSPNCDDTAVQMVTQKPGRVLVDFYDDFFGLTDGLPDARDKFAVEIAKQEFCIEKADALCCRDIQLQYRRKALGIGRHRPVICFPDYCWNRDSLRPAREDDAVHIVQTGWVGFESRGEEDIGCFLVARKFVDAGCHFHFYLHPTFPALGSALFKSVFEQYIDLGAKTGRVHFHATVPPHEIAGEMAKYDYGFGMMNAANFPDIPWKHSNPKRLPYCGSSRVFDYLDAGLGILLDGNLRYMRHVFEPYGVLFNGTAILKGGNIYEALRQKPSRPALVGAREALSLERHVPRLAKFYESLG